MIKKLVRYGNSQALVLDRAILELLGIQEGGEVSLSIEKDVLLVKPVLTAVERRPVLKEPEVLIEVRKIHEKYLKNASEGMQAIRNILLSQIANNNPVELFRGDRTPPERIAALGDFVFHNFPEFKERMRSYVRALTSETAQLFNNRGPADEAEIQAWYMQEGDRLQEHTEVQKAKKEKAYADIGRISEQSLNNPSELENLLTPEIIEQVIGLYMAKLHTELAVGIFD